MIRPLVLVALITIPVAARTQSVPGTNIRLAVVATGVARSGDTVTVKYHLANSVSSGEQMRAFTIETPGAPTRLEWPLVSSLDWHGSTRYGNRAVARWAVLDSTTLAPGSSAPDLAFSAIGVPGIVDAHVQGYYPPKELVEDTLRVETDPLLTNAIHIRVVGVVAADPSASVPSLLSRLGTLLAEYCALGWVSNAGICQSLQAKVDAATRALLRGDPGAATSQLNALINELNAQRGKQVDDNAYFLLRTNAEYIVSRI